MTRREALLSAGLLFVLAMLFRVVVASWIAFPKPEDTAYYVGVARNLIEGRGMVSDALWSYQTPPLIFPRPAFEVWLPLPTLLAAIPMLILGATFSAAQVSSVLVGAVVPVLAWRLAADVATERGLSVGRARSLALGTGLTTAVYLPLVLHSGLPDSTMPFAALALSGCLVMSRVDRDPRGLLGRDPRLLVIGVLIGLAALTRNEAIWLGLAWAIVAMGLPRTTRLSRIRGVVVAAFAALVVFAPWAVRNWIVFGSPLPGQAATNALSVTGFDIFAWNDPPTVDRYLAAGPMRLLEMRVEGVSHNLVSVLLLPGMPLSLIGLVALPWHLRSKVLRPVLLVTAFTFFVTSLIFPVATTWGTFLHAAGTAHVLLVVSALLGLDALIDRIGRIRGWTRPVAWLGSTLGMVGSLLFSVALLPSFGIGASTTASQYEQLGVRSAAAGYPLDRSAGPVITNFPIWLAETHRIPTLGLPNEPPNDVVDLAGAFPGTHLLLLVDARGPHWPADLMNGTPGAECFQEIDLGPGPTGEPDLLGNTHLYEIVCP